MQSRGKIAVVGATGTVGRHVVGVLGASGRDVVAISRSNGVDVVTGDGLAQALAGVECIIDASNSPANDQEAATAFFTAAARNLHEAGVRAGVRRIVVVSIIGCDRFAAGYYAAKAAHERAMRSGPLPAEVLRAAQFHELVAKMVEWGRRDGVSYVRKMRIQPVAARTVAQALAEMATSSSTEPGPGGTGFHEIAGPREEKLVDLARLLVARRGDAVRIEDAGRQTDSDGALYEAGALLPGPGATLAGPTFEEWLGSAL